MATRRWESGAFSRIAPLCGTLLLVVVHVVAFADELFYPIVRGGLSLAPEAVWRHGQVHRLLTGIFISEGARPASFFFVIAFLWIFARELERRFGTGELLYLYVLGGIASNALWSFAAVVWYWVQPMHFAGAVGVLAMVRLLQGPRSNLRVFRRVGGPAWIFAAAYFAGSAWLLHAGLMEEASLQICAALFALCYHFFDWRLGTLSVRWRVRRRRPRTPSPSPAVLPPEPQDVAPLAGPVERHDGEFESRVDELLRKISESGLESLTEDEIQLLLEASQRYRGRPQD